MDFKDYDMPREAQEYFQKQQDERERMHASGNYMSHVHSEVEGKRFRIIGNRGCWRPAKETFHEFLIFVLENTLGREWYSDQLKLSLEDRHFMAQGIFHFNEWRKMASKRSSTEEGKWIATLDGWSKTIVTLAFDIYSLHHTNNLPEHLLLRLKHKEQYQGARYEIAIAALFARLKCKIEFLDAEERQTKPHCEFIATHDETNVSIAVEAKSRHRAGVIHTPGKRDERKLLKADIRRLFNRALKQNPGDRPFVIFVDLNSPLTPNSDFDEKPWSREVRRILNSYSSGHKPNVCNGYFVTNYAFYYQAKKETEAGEFMAMIPAVSKFQLPSLSFIELLQKGLDGYHELPNLE